MIQAGFILNQVSKSHTQCLQAQSELTLACKSRFIRRRHVVSVSLGALHRGDPKVRLSLTGHPAVEDDRWVLVGMY
jgi:hypothetical protein